MDTYTAVMIAEGVEPADSETTIAAWQYLVDTGLAWSLQGTFGRTAAALIENGILQRPRPRLVDSPQPLPLACGVRHRCRECGYPDIEEARQGEDGSWSWYNVNTGEENGRDEAPESHCYHCNTCGSDGAPVLCGADGRALP